MRPNSERDSMASDALIRPPIAVVGVSALFPGSLHATGFWRNILSGADLITEVPPSHWLIEDYYDPDPKAEDKTYAKRGAFLPKVDFALPIALVRDVTVPIPAFSPKNKIAGGRLSTAGFTRVMEVSVISPDLEILDGAIRVTADMGIAPK